MTATEPAPVDLQPADLELLVSRAVEAARRTPQELPRRRRLLARTATGLALVAGLLIVGVLMSARLPDSTAQQGVEPSPPAPASLSPSLMPSASQSPSVGPSSSTTTWDVGGLSFTTPAGWHFVTAHRWTMPVGPMAFLSSVPVTDPCATEFLAGEACWKPVDALPADGMLVTFSGSAVVTTRDMWGKVTTGAADARCASLGGEEQMGAIFGGFGVSACLQGPDLAPGEAAFRQIVASLLASTGGG